MELSLVDILATQRNRHPLLFIDKITDISPGEHATAIKNYTYNEWYSLHTLKMILMCQDLSR